VVAIASEDLETAQGLATKLGLSFPLLADPDRAVIRAFGVEDTQNEIAWPAIFVIGPSGNVSWRSLSETYKKRATVDEILHALGEIPK
jgi:peroxiredoxin